MKKIICFFVCFIFFSAIYADKGIYTYTASGNIFFYSKNADRILQLTHSEKSKHPVLSPDGRWLAFVERSNHIIPGHCGDLADTGSKYSDEIWIDDLQKMKLTRLVKNNFNCDSPSKIIVDPKKLIFSPNSKTLYFETSAGITYDAVRAVNVDGKNLRLVTYGGEYHVIKNGKYKGDLIVNQHRYRFKGDTSLGSYDWDWLYSPAGKQIRLWKKENF